MTDMCDGWGTFQKYYDGMCTKSPCNIFVTMSQSGGHNKKMVMTEICDGWGTFQKKKV